MRIRSRTDDRCCHCGTRWSAGWFSPQSGPMASFWLCADCNCGCGHRGVDHADCDPVRQYTASRAPAPKASGPVEPRLFP